MSLAKNEPQKDLIFTVLKRHRLYTLMWDIVTEQFTMFDKYTEFMCVCGAQFETEDEMVMHVADKIAEVM